MTLEGEKEEGLYRATVSGSCAQFYIKVNIGNCKPSMTSLISTVASLDKGGRHVESRPCRQRRDPDLQWRIYL